MEETSDSGCVSPNKHIDSLPMFCNWTIDIVFIFFIFAEVGIYFASDFTGTCMIIFLGWMITWSYSKTKNNTIKGYFKQILYRTNFVEPTYLVPSYKRKFLGA